MFLIMFDTKLHPRFLKTEIPGSPPRLFQGSVWNQIIFITLRHVPFHFYECSQEFSRGCMAGCNRSNEEASMRAPSMRAPMFSTMY